MTPTRQERTDAAADPAGDVLGQLMGDFAATAGVVLTALGRRLGLWDALEAGPAPADVVAERAGAALPYVREWLRSQAAAGYVSYDPAAETFRLAPGVAAVLGDGPLSGLADGMAAQFAVWWSQLDRYEAAFRTGQGIAWGTLPAAHAEGMDMITRAVVAPALAAQWLPAVDGIAARLSAGAAAADVGCGYGAACVTLAEAFPASRFTGFDIDDASVARARRMALAAGVADRVSFEVAAAADISGGPYELVTFIDSLHDLGDPAGALRRARQVLADDGVVLLAEHAGSGKLEENLHDEAVLGGGRYATDAAGYAAMLAGVRRWPHRTWAIEGSRGIGRHLASRLVAEGERVVDVPPKLSARTRVFTAGQGRKTDATDAHAVALAATRMRGLHLVTGDAQLEMLRVLAGRRRALGEDHTRVQ